MKNDIEREIIRIQDNCDHSNRTTIDTPTKLWYKCPDCDYTWFEVKEGYKV